MFPSSYYAPSYYAPTYFAESTDDGGPAAPVGLPGPYFPPAYFPPYFVSGYYPSPVLLLSGVPGVRDWDILESIRAVLEGTGAFDGVYLSDLPEIRGRSTELPAIAIVSPLDWEEVDESDDPTDVQDERQVRWELTLIVRHEDAPTRDRRCDQLLSICQNALDYQCLAGTTIPAYGKLRRGKYAPASPPERRMVVVGEFSYLTGTATHATED